MKKILITILVCLFSFNLCACAPTTAPAEAEEKVIGYIIISHYDGDEHIDITDYTFSNYGAIIAFCEDGRKIVSNNITVILNDD